MYVMFFEAKAHGILKLESFVKYFLEWRLWK